jgi:hypothetical protein
MAVIIFIVAAGIFVIGVVVGIIAVVSYGIHREQRHFQQLRRFEEDRGLWGDRDPEEHYLREEPVDGVTSAARQLTGLYVRHQRQPARQRVNPRQAAWPNR